VDLSTKIGATTSELRSLLRSLYPNMPEQILADFLPLVEGNIRHIKWVIDSKRPITDAEHKEWVLALGRGFDWLHEPNAALIVGPYDPIELGEAIVTAGMVLKGNVEAGRINPDNGLALLVSTAYRGAKGYSRREAEESARYYTRYAQELLEKNVPEIWPYMKTLTGTVNMDDRVLTTLQ
jgi:hypothetical protein